MQLMLIILVKKILSQVQGLFWAIGREGQAQGWGWSSCALLVAETLEEPDLTISASAQALPWPEPVWMPVPAGSEEGREVGVGQRLFRNGLEGCNCGSEVGQE